ncbi:DNA methyltransferase [Parasphingorhabdus sp.]|uniref:DNA methyltransferase n=1 Tax=Parasphingorhabdus sp. TaxID=2709688 RepID=UPI003A8E728B
MKIYEKLEAQLKTHNDYVTDEGELKKWVVINKAQNHDPELIAILLNNPELKTQFFIKAGEALVFDQTKFVRFLEQKNYLNDSFTAYRNKVGLAIDGKLLPQRNEVALVWPFKDCVLEGGQSRDEDKREEIFFNEVLAQDEITQLLEPKVLTKGKRFDKDGEKPSQVFNRDAEINKKRGLPEDTITDNLIIKGNNLLALHSLAAVFAGKVKLIYIDPPYNTGSDSFRYNDRFSQSTWLTFLRNRLEIAKKLLREDGAIFVQINDHNHAYVKLVLDEVFGQENFINLVSLRTKSPSGFKTVNLGLFETAEYIAIFGIRKEAFRYNPQFAKSAYDDNYKYIVENIEDDPSDWKIDDIRKLICRSEGINPDEDRQFFKKLKEILGEGVAMEKIAEYALDNASKIFRLTAIGNDASKETLQAKKASKKEPDKIFKVERNGHSTRYVLNGQEMAFYERKIRDLDGEITPTTILTNIWTDIAYEGIAGEGGVSLPKGKKPEKLLRRVIEMASNAGEIVLDFHLGSGTTAAVAHKLGRQFIGIEQLEYGENDSVIREKNVIAGDASGISKAVGWKGGGSFTYLELKKYNQDFIEQIEAAKNSKALLKIWASMKDHSFLNYNVDLQRQEEHLDEFKALDLADQKAHLVSLLDKNQLYVNLSSMHDKDFACTDAEKKLTRDFYKIER